jgi:hypothetical protein
MIVTGKRIGKETARRIENETFATRKVKSVFVM